MVLELGIVIGFLLALIGMSDLILSNEQKESINTLATKLWNEADETKRLSYSERLVDKRVSVVTLCLVAPLVIIGFYNTAKESVPQALAGFIGFLAVAWIAPRPIAWVKKNRINPKGMIYLFLIFSFITFFLVSSISETAGF